MLLEVCLNICNVYTGESYFVSRDPMYHSVVQQESQKWGGKVPQNQLYCGDNLTIIGKENIMFIDSSESSKRHESCFLLVAIFHSKIV